MFYEHPQRERVVFDGLKIEKRTLEREKENKEKERKKRKKRKKKKKKKVKPFQDHQKET